MELLHFNDYIHVDRASLLTCVKYDTRLSEALEYGYLHHIVLIHIDKTLGQEHVLLEVGHITTFDYIPTPLLEPYSILINGGTILSTINGISEVHDFNIIVYELIH